MPRASTRNTRPDAAAQFQTRGYIVSEEDDLALLDIANALDAVSMLCEERKDDVPEMTRAMWGGLFRTFSRQVKAIHDQASYANDAMARRRDLDLNI